MEANFFRFLAGELAQTLTGQRIEKVHGPADGITILTLHGQGSKSHLIFRPAKSAGLLFVSAERPHNPFTAPARIMWLRKRLTGRRLLSCRYDWPSLRLAFALSPRDVPAAGQWLVLDLRTELSLAETFEPGPEPAWPALERILDDGEVWRAHPQLTPPLRKRLAALAQADPNQAAQLLHRLASGQACAFCLPQAQTAPPLAWDAGEPGCEHFPTAMEAARTYGERALFTQLGQAEVREGQDQAALARKRLKRQLDLLDKDEARHRALSELTIPAEALQIVLSELKARPLPDALILDHPERGPVSVPLNPRLNAVENMAQLFQQAAKGRRGQEHVARRRALLLAGAGPELLPSRPRHSGQPCPAAPPAPLVLPKRYQGLAVALFRTSDGFLVLRGKSSQANHQMLSQAAGPHDLWLHAAGGPSAHVILRRDYPDQQVPEQSLLEAAGLCALKSWRKDDAKAEVLCARVKDVRKVKGAAMGSVAVDQVERVLLVALDTSLEERLAVGGEGKQGLRP